MIDFTFENQGTITYLVYTMAPDEMVDSMSLGMLTNNKIAGLATTIFTQIDANKYIKYNVSAKISAKQFFTGAVNKKRLLGVFKGIVNALLSAEDYMIDTRTVILDLNYIFADVSTCDTVLICLPVQGKEEQHDLGAFFKEIMFGTQFDQTENCDHIARIINYLNSTPMFSLTDFKEVLEQIDNTAATPVAQSVAQPVAPVAKPAVQQPSVIPAIENTSRADETTNISKQVDIVTPVVQNQFVQGPVSPNAQIKVTPPLAASANQAVQPTNMDTSGSEKQISVFSLLMHYSKENAEAYKAQKAAKKNVGKAPTPDKTKPQKKQHQANVGFAVPTQSNNLGFAIPGQAATPQPTPPASQAQKSALQIQQRPITTPTPTPTQQVSFVPRQTPQGKPANFGETTVLGGGAIGETTVLTAAQNPNKMIAPYLMRKKNNEKISLNKPVFRVGKERSYVDYFIGDNTAISRSHANFITRDGKYFVVDTNSTNHTFVDGVMIQSNEEREITNGDTIRLANEDFEFKLF